MIHAACIVAAEVIVTFPVALLIAVGVAGMFGRRES